MPPGQKPPETPPPNLKAYPSPNMGGSARGLLLSGHHKHQDCRLVFAILSMHCRLDAFHLRLLTALLLPPLLELLRDLLLAVVAVRLGVCAAPR